ncbi:MAG TPA: GNAT family N-acetyltransferase, partial [Nitrososphaera sp.]|nr:GNAT family N-acetyltransferase [Nitrososphaera sp.]
DTMYVLAAGSGTAAGKTEVAQIDRSSLPVWIDTFCRSFAVPQWKTEVGRIMDASFGRLKLLLSYKDGVPAGCAALFSKNGVTGLYCLGTVSQLRGRGLAKEILKSAMSKDLFLQTLGSEGLVPFYEKAGFAVANTKKIYVVRRASKLKGSRNRAVK